MRYRRGAGSETRRAWQGCERQRIAKTYKSSMRNTCNEDRGASQVVILRRERFGRVLQPIGEEGVSGRRGVVRDGRECYKKASTGSGLVERKARRVRESAAGRMVG